VRSGLETALRLLRGVLDAVSALLLVAVLIVVSAQVVARYVLGVAMPWGEELTRLLFVWLVMIAATRAAHLRIDLLEGRLGPAGRRGLALASAFVSILLLAVLVRYGWSMVELTTYDRYTALGVSVQYLYWSVVIGGSLWIFLILADLAFPAESRAELPPA
jgi:TRAP-type transport system small permease protein